MWKRRGSAGRAGRGARRLSRCGDPETALCTINGFVEMNSIRKKEKHIIGISRLHPRFDLALPSLAQSEAVASLVPSFPQLLRRTASLGRFPLLST
jgi:hypothetical protein